jgi:protein TonB
MIAAANVLAYCAQASVVILLCAGLPRLLRLSAPAAQYVFWRLVLLVCLALPFLQPWHAPMTTVLVTAAPVDASAVPAVALPQQTSPSVVPFSLDILDTAVLVWMGGLSCRLVWLAAGVSRLRRLRRRAQEDVYGLDDLKSLIGTFPAVRWSEDVRHPVTFGLIRPLVLLPVALKSVERDARIAVIAHELHHVRRRDWAWVVVEELVRSAFWFHPPMWWLISRVQLARETVVDELSILVTNARRAYLDALLTFADDTGFASSPAFSARRHLFHRVMLLSKERDMSSIRVAVGSSVLVIALGAGTWGAAQAFPLQSCASVQERTPPRDPRTPAEYHRQAQQYWEKANKELSLSQEEKLDVIAKGLAAEDRALAINPDYLPALTYKDIFLRMQANLTNDPAQTAPLLRQADELRDKVRALQALNPRETGATPATSVPERFAGRLAELRPIRIGGGIKPPTKIKDVKPFYPPVALAARVQGVVIVEAIIDATGDVVEARVLRSIPLLDEAALEAVQQWRFMPTVVDGVPQAVVMTVTVNFTLQ